MWSSYNPNKSRQIRALEFSALVLIITFSLLTVVTCAFFILKPTSPVLFGNVLPLDKWYYFPVNYLLASYMTFIGVTELELLLILTLQYGGFLIPIFVKEFRLGRKSYKTLPTLRSPRRLRVMYRCAQIIQQQVNNVIGKVLAPIQALATVMTILASFMVIKYRDTMEMIPLMMMVTYAFITPVLWGAVLVAGGDLHSHGNKVLNSWRYHKWVSAQERKEMKKFRASCKPFTLAFGKTFTIRRVTIMNFIQGLSRGMVRALLMLKVPRSK